MKMKFKRTSLRLYLLLVTILLSVSLVVGYSWFSAHLFIQGMDTVLKGSMSDLARTYGRGELFVPEESPAKIASYHMARKWQDIPEEIRSEFPSASETQREFLKKIDGFTFGHPRKATFILPVEMEDGQVIFASKQYVRKEILELERTHKQLSPPKKSILILVGIGLLVILLLLLGIWLMLKSISEPLAKLANWAGGLDRNTIASPIPDFRYKELNQIASLVQSSVATVHDTLEREKLFLGHASHELRTPIAVIRNNLELLRRLHEQMDGRDLKVVSRLERAAHTMEDLTNTLLWLNRQTDGLPQEQIAWSLDKLIQELVDELDYLLSGKNITVSLELAPCYLLAPKVPLRIIVSNLIRNAFQHTQKGNIFIRTEGNNIVIINDITSSDTDKTDSDLGFGLGLLLVERLAGRLNLEHRLWREDSKQFSSISMTYWTDKQ